jgi:hypothetical protein
MKKFDPSYKSIIINRLPLIYNFALCKDYNTVPKDGRVTYKTIRPHGLKIQRVFPFYKLISKIEI